MATVINSDTQFTDESTGELINNGFIYIGLDGQDAKLNPAIIYSDRELTVVLANPQRTGADGRSVNKIWVSGKYSMKVENFENVQKLNRLSLGEITQTGNTILTNVQGADALTANASPTITALVDRQVYILTAAAANTTAMTLTIDLTPTWPIKKHHDLDMVANDTETGQVLAVIWNETDSVYEIMTNSAIAPVDVATAQTITGVKTFTIPIVADITGNITGSASIGGTFRFLKGSDIASANDLVLLQDGNSNDITGTTTVNGMTDGIQNEVRHFHADADFLMKHNTAASGGFSSLFIVQGEADINVKAGDEWDEIYDDVLWRVFNYNKADGRAITAYPDIESVTFTVAGNDLTAGLNPTQLTFRSATLTDGVPVERSIASAITIVVPDTATLGAVSGQLTRLYELAIDNAGTLEPALVNAAGGVNLNEEGLISTTAISTGADSNNVIYSTTARSNVAYRVVGMVEFTQAVAGTYATAPSLKQGMGGNALTSMSSLGYGQTYQDVAVSRAFGTTYYNTGSKPMFVVVSASAATTAGTLAFVNDSITRQRNSSAAINLEIAFSFIVQPGKSYSINIVTGTGWAVDYWNELK